jgi:hypothetical protein
MSHKRSTYASNRRSSIPSVLTQHGSHQAEASEEKITSPITHVTRQLAPHAEDDIGEDGLGLQGRLEVEDRQTLQKKKTCTLG